MLAKVEIKQCSQILSKIITLLAPPPGRGEGDRLVNVPPSMGRFEEHIETLVLGLVDVVIETILSLHSNSSTYVSTSLCPQWKAW